MSTAAPQAPADTTTARRSTRFSARDLVTVALFGALYVVVAAVFGMAGALGPAVWLAVVPVTILANGITFALFFARVRHAGMFLLFSLILTAFFLLHGGAIVAVFTTPLIGLIVEFIARAGKYRARWSLVASYALFGLAGFTPLLPMVLNREEHLSSAAWQSMGEEYVRAAEQLFTPGVLGLVLLGCLVAGVLGGLLGAVMLRKHFRAAGLA